jgi:hypothetical protein
VRKSRPRVPSRFSSLRQSEVRNTPAEQTKAKLRNLKMPKRIGPTWARRVPFSISEITINATAMKMAASAAMARDQ